VAAVSRPRAATLRRWATASLRMPSPRLVHPVRVCRLPAGVTQEKAVRPLSGRSRPHDGTRRGGKAVCHRGPASRRLAHIVDRRRPMAKKCCALCARTLTAWARRPQGIDFQGWSCGQTLGSCPSPKKLDSHHFPAAGGRWNTSRISSNTAAPTRVTPAGHRWTTSL
jgi:hypothetical protein